MLCLRSVFTSQKEELLDSSTENSNNDFLKCSLPRKVSENLQAFSGTRSDWL